MLFCRASFPEQVLHNFTHPSKFLSEVDIGPAVSHLYEVTQPNYFSYFLAKQLDSIAVIHECLYLLIAYISKGI